MSVDSRTLGNPGTAAFQLEKYPFFILNRMVGRYNSLIGSGLSAIGIDIPYWRVLLLLGEAAPRSVGNLASAAMINESTMLRIVQRMQRDGLISCSRSQADARVTEVELMALGTEKLVAAREIAAPIYNGLIAGVSARDFERLLALLGRLQTNLDIQLTG
jgi:DNA-binding MarR family transcriptional regulator